VKEEDGFLLVKSPEENELESAIGTSKWMVRGATAEAFGRGSGSQVEIVGPHGQIGDGYQGTAASCSAEEAVRCSNHVNPFLEW